MSIPLIVGIGVVISCLITLYFFLRHEKRYEKVDRKEIDSIVRNKESCLRPVREVTRLFWEHSRDWPLDEKAQERIIFNGAINSGERGQKIEDSIRKKETPTLSLLPFVYEKLGRLLERAGKGYKSAYTGRMTYLDLKFLSSLIKTDQAMSALMLREVNIETRSEATDVTLALGLLGPKKTLEIMSELKPLDQLVPYKEIISLFDWNHFWTHSLNVAITSELLAGQLLIGSKDIAWLCGLIHDVGKLILLFNYPEEYSTLLKTNVRNHGNLIEAEYEKLNGLTHPEVGTMAALEWKWPKSIINIIKYHHYPWLLDDTKDIGVVVHIANSIVLASGLGAYSGANRPPIPIHFGHHFRSNSATCSGANRPPLKSR